MKMFKCPECRMETEYLVAKIHGRCTMTPDGDSKLEEWETGDANCEHCGYEETGWNNQFEIVELED